MKKILLLVSLVVFWFGVAEMGVEYIDVKMDASKLKEAHADLSQIEIDFCGKEGERTISYTIAPGWTQDICYKATNISNKDITITVDFVDGTFTNDQWQNKACKQQWEKENFGQYVTGYTQTFTVEANNIVYQHAKIQVPKTSSGMIYGCLVYYTQGVELGGQMNFTVLMRKAKFIDIIIKEQKLSVWWKVGWLIFFISILLFFIKLKQKKLLIF